eukprot:15399508-Alexandrium_andersonii.AAC.1
MPMPGICSQRHCREARLPLPLRARACTRGTRLTAARTPAHARPPQRTLRPASTKMPTHVGPSQNP